MKHFFGSQASNLAPKTGRRLGNSLVVRRVSSGFLTKYAIASHIKPGTLELTVRRGQSNISMPLLLLASEKNVVIVSFRPRFGRTAKF